MSASFYSAALAVRQAKHDKIAPVVLPQAAGWRTMGTRGLAGLSPPEAEHTVLELPTNRAEYIGVLQEIGDYPARSPIGQRAPGEDEVAALARTAGRWRAVVLLDDERALKNAAGLFSRVFVLDPFFDSGALLYAAWHDPLIRDEHSRRLAEQAGLLVRAGPLLNAGTAILTPDHLPGSWNPRPGWRKPRPSADRRQRAGWSMRSCLVLLYWADRLDGVVCTAQDDVIAALDVALGPRARSSSLDIAEPPRIDAAQTAREAVLAELGPRWAAIRRLSRRRAGSRLEDVAYALTSLSEAGRYTTEQRHAPWSAAERGPAPWSAAERGPAPWSAAERGSWRLALGDTTLPDPALLIRRVLNGQDPARQPRLPLKKLRRRPLCLVPAQN